MSSECTKSRRGQPLALSERNKVLDVLEHFQQTMNKSRAVEACSEATGRSTRMIYKLAKEKEEGTLKAPKRSKRPHVKSHMRIMKYKGDVRSCIRRIVHSCFTQQLPPVLTTIMETLNALQLYPAFKRGTLYNLLKDMGFEYERRGNKGIFVENASVLTDRHSYLQRIRDARELNIPIVYTGELWLNLAKLCPRVEDTAVKQEVKEILLKREDEDSPIMQEVKGKLIKEKVEEKPIEQRFHGEVSPVLVLVNAGDMQGFIKGAKLTLFSYTDKTDIREAMATEKYENWFFNQLLPNCPKCSLIVMDSVKYNSRKVGNVPTRSWPKDDTIEWLENAGIQVDSTLSISELIELVNSVKDDCDDLYKIDSECEQLGFEVLRMPQHHRELNPIHMVWDQIEHSIKSQSCSLKREAVLQLIDESYLRITNENWSSYVTEVKANEDFLWRADCLQANVDSLIGKLKWTRSDS